MSDEESKIFETIWSQIVLDAKPSTELKLNSNTENENTCIQITYNSIGVFDFDHEILSSPYHKKLIADLDYRGLNIKQNKIDTLVQFDILIGVKKSDKMAA